MLPLYGTWRMRSPVISLKSSAVRCGELPVPLDANDMPSGLAFARSISSFTLFAGTLLFTTSTSGLDATSDTKVKSLSAS